MSGLMGLALEATVHKRSRRLLGALSFFSTTASDADETWEKAEFGDATMEIADEETKGVRTESVFLLGLGD